MDSDEFEAISQHQTILCGLAPSEEIGNHILAEAGVAPSLMRLPEASAAELLPIILPVYLDQPAHLE